MIGLHRLMDSVVGRNCPRKSKAVPHATNTTDVQKETLIKIRKLHY